MAHYVRLILTKPDYIDLCSHNGVHTFVFQFTHNGANPPGLRAYAMKQLHKAIAGNPFKNLGPDPLNQPPVPLPDLRIQGDLQITKNMLDDLLKDCNNPASAYTYFLFTPKTHANGIHVCYEITVVPTTLPPLAKQLELADPSPPATAL